MLLFNNLVHLYIRFIFNFPISDFSFHLINFLFKFLIAKFIFKESIVIFTFIIYLGIIC